jgi:hypothetical protein
MFNDVTMDCAKVFRTQIQQCDNAIYVVDRPLILHNYTLWEKIKHTPQLSILREVEVYVVFF